MAFKEVHGLDLSDSDVIKVFENKYIPQGQCINAQFLRQYKDESWTLELRAGKIKFFIELPEYEAKKVIDDNLDGITRYECKIIKSSFESWDF